jgi:hypothetical protein
VTNQRPRLASADPNFTNPDFTHTKPSRAFGDLGRVVEPLGSNPPPNIQAAGSCADTDGCRWWRRLRVRFRPRLRILEPRLSFR